MFSENVLIAIVSVVGATLTTYLTVAGKRRFTRKPKDRMETIFDGYEKLIKQQELEIARKGSAIQRLEELVSKQEEELRTTKSLLNTVKDELEDSKRQNSLLTHQLQAMKIEYKEQGI